MSNVININLHLAERNTSSSIFLPASPVDITRNIDIKLGEPINITLNTSLCRNIKNGNAVSLFMLDRSCLSLVIDDNKIIYIVFENPCCKLHNPDKPIQCNLIEIEKNKKYQFREPHTFSSYELAIGVVINANIFSFNIKVDTDTLNKKEHIIKAEQKNKGRTVSLILQRIGPDIDVYVTYQILITSRV